MKILLIESSPLPSKLASALSSHHLVTASDLGSRLIFQLIKQNYQLILIWSKDLPFLRLKKIVKFIRERFPNTSVLVCGAGLDSPQRATILMTGVRDCIADKICADELLLKVSIVTQTPNNLRHKKPFIKQHFVFDFMKNTASYKGVFISLNKKESAILRCLLNQANNTVLRKTIYNSVWSSPTPPNSNSLDVHISSLRRKIEKPFNLKLIESVKGVGYRAKSD